MPELYRPNFIHDYDIEITQFEDWPWLIRVMPYDNITGELYLEDTSNYTGIFSLHAPDAGGEEILTVDTVSGEVVLGFTPEPVARNTAYGLGQQVIPVALNGFMYQCSDDGTTHASNEPTWPTTIGATVTDGTVQWTCIKTDAHVANVAVYIGTDITNLLQPWGRGFYTLSVKDPFHHSFFHIDGKAYLRQAASGPAG